MAREPIAPLATRHFTSEEFNTRLAERLLKKKKPEEREAPDSGEWDRILEAAERGRAERRGGDSTSPDMSEFEGMSTKLKDPEPNAFMKGINFLTEPLSGGAIGRKMREITDAAPPIREDYFKATGKGDVQDWLAWSEATLKGLGRGVPEGVADLADQMTSPADLAGLIAGGGAVTLGRRGIQGARALRQITRAAGIPNLIRGGRDVAVGGKNIFDEGLNFENAKEVGEGALRLAAGGAQMHFPEEAIAPRAKAPLPAVKEDGLHLRLREEGEPFKDLPLQEQGAEPDFAGETSLRRPGYEGRTGGLDKQRIPQSYDRPLPAEDFRHTNPEAPAPKSDRSHAMDTLREELRARGIPDEEILRITPEEITKPIEELQREPEPDSPRPVPHGREADIDINDQLFPEMANRTTKPKIDIGIQESSLAPDPKARLDELGAKSELTPAEDAEFDRLIDQLHPTTAPRDNGVAGFMKDERGEIDFDALYNKYQRMKRERQKPPTALVPEVMPAENVQLSHGEPIEQVEPEMKMAQALPGARDVAKLEKDLFEGTNKAPASRFRKLLSDEAGAVGPGKRKARLTAVPDPKVVWDQLPDNVRKTFEERGVGPADLKGYNMRDIEDTFNAIVRENSGLLPEAPAPKASNEGVVDVSNVKFDTPQSTAKLVKKSGERVPAITDEEAQIKRLSEEAMRAVERERKIRLDAGEREMTPDEIDSIRNRMESGDRSSVEDIAQNREVASRESIPDLDSSRYLKTELKSGPQRPPRAKTSGAVPAWLKEFMKDEKGELNLEGLLRGEETPAGTDEFAPDLELQKQRIGGSGGGYSTRFNERQPRPDVQMPEPTPEPASRSVMDKIRDFMADEEGSIKFGSGNAKLPVDEALQNTNKPELAPLSQYYIDTQLHNAGEGRPGLSAEPDPNFRNKNLMNIVYRNPAGDPIAVARVSNYPGEGWTVTDFAATPKSGLLKGRAVKAIVDELIEIGAIKPSGSYSDATANLVQKARQRMSGEQVPEGASPAPNTDFKAQRRMNDALANREGMFAMREREKTYGRDEGYGNDPYLEEPMPDLVGDEAGRLSYGERYINRGRSNVDVLDALWRDYGEHDFNRMNQEDWNAGYDMHEAEIDARSAQMSTMSGVQEPMGDQFHREVMQHYRRSNPDLPTSPLYPTQANDAPYLNRFMGDANEMYAQALEYPSPGDAMIAPGVTPQAMMRAPGGLDEGVVPLSFRDRIRNFMQDESGEIRFGEEVPAPQKELGPKGEIPRESGPTIKLLDEEQLQPGIRVDERSAPEQTEPSMARKTWNTAQSMMSIDLPYMTSAAFRQASPLAWTDNWFKSWSKAAESFTSKEAYDALMQEIKDSKYFKPRYKPVVNQDGKILRYKELPSVAEELGLRLTDYSHLGQREESLRHSLAEHIPVYKDYLNKSNRAYTAFLNSLRKSKFEQMMDAQTWTGLENDTRVAKQIAEFVNDATGRSSLKVKTPLGEINAEKNAEDLAKILWSPRLLSSRLKFLNPTTYIAADPAVRQEYIKGLFNVIGTWGAFAGLAKFGLGAEVGTDMNSSDFGKIKIGNTRIDPGSGFQQLLVFGSRMATGEFTSSSTDKKTRMGEGFKPRTRKSTAEEFAASKLHPAAKLAYDLLSASQSSPVHVGDRLIQMALPMMAQDMMEVMKENPELAVMMGPLSSVGFGTSNYGRGDEFGKPVFTDEIDEFMGFDPRTTSLTVGGNAPRQTPRR